MGLSNAIRSNLIKALLTKEALISYSSFYIGLSTTLPTGDGNNIAEPVGGDYARQPLLEADFTFQLSNDQAVLVLNKDVFFPTASADWRNGDLIPYVVLFSALSGGVYLGFGQLYQAKSVTAGDTFKISTNKYVMGLL